LTNWASTYSFKCGTKYDDPEILKLRFTVTNKRATNNVLPLKECTEKLENKLLMFEPTFDAEHYQIEILQMIVSRRRDMTSKYVVVIRKQANDGGYI
jgi:hypothetical protein